MFEIYKNQIIKNTIRQSLKIKKWPKKIPVHYRYSTLGTGLDLLFLLIRTRKGLTILELSNKLHKSAKTIRRLLAVFDEKRIPIVEIDDTDERKHYRLRYKIMYGWSDNLKL